MIQKGGGVRIATLFFGPLGKDKLCISQGVTHIGNTKRLIKSVILTLRQKSDLVAEVFQIIVNWCRRKQQHFGFDTTPDDTLHQPLVTAHPYQLTCFVSFVGRVISEVM